MKNCLVLLLAGACAQPVLACDLCAIYAATSAHGEAGKGPFLGVAEQFTHFGTLQLDGKEVNNPSGQYFDSSISQVFAGYNFSDRVGLQFTLPVIYRSFKRPNGEGGIDRGTESGIGDASLLANFVAYRKETRRSTFSWSLLGGVKFPTGSSDRIKEEFREMENPIGPPSGIHGHDLALGTGSYDGVVGSSVYGRSHRGFISANVQYAIRSTGDFDSRFANDLTWSGGPGFYLLLHDEYSLALQAVVSGEYKGKDTFQGHTAADTGVTGVYLGPQVAFTLGSKLSAQLGLDLPVSIQNTSLQTVPDYRVRAAVTWRF